MTDHGALVVTAWATIAGAVGTIGAVVVALGLALREARRDRESREAAEQLRREDEDTRRRAERRALYLRLALEIATDYEPFVTRNPDRWVAAHHRILGNLSALPLSYLGLLRWETNLMPDERDRTRYLGIHEEFRSVEIRDEIRALIYNLSGEGAQDYLPPGSPTANRPRPAPVYP